MPVFRAWSNLEIQKLRQTVPEVQGDRVRAAELVKEAVDLKDKPAITFASQKGGIEVLLTSNTLRYTTVLLGGSFYANDIEEKDAVNILFTAIEVERSKKLILGANTVLVVVYGYHSEFVKSFNLALSGDQAEREEAKRLSKKANEDEIKDAARLCRDNETETGRELFTELFPDRGFPG